MDAREDAKTHQLDTPNQAHASRNQDWPQDLLPVRISTRTRDMADKIRDINKSIKAFVSTQQLS